MPNRKTDTFSISAKEMIAFLLRQGMPREALLCALEEAPDGETQDEPFPCFCPVIVSYAPLPSRDELRNEFGAGSVSVIFDGRPWQKHHLCAQMDEVDGERVMTLKHFGQEMTI